MGKRSVTALRLGLLGLLLPAALAVAGPGTAIGAPLPPAGPGGRPALPKTPQSTDSPSSPSSPGSPGSRDEAVAGHDVRLDQAAHQRVLRYWTRKRMHDAVAPAGPRRRAMATSAAPAPGRGAARVRAVTGAPWTRGGAIARTAGKVFFTLGAKDYVCSGTTVTGANRDTVATAGHCAKDDTGPWSRNLMFVPGYRNGAKPYGGYPARRMFVPEQWSARGAEDYDVAMVVLSTSAGRHVADVVGTQGIAFGRPRSAPAYVFGYPAAGRYDGERLYYCSGIPRTHPGTTGQGLRCDMSQGSSGGGWLTGFNPSTGRGVLTSVNSFKFASDRSTLYGTYFGSAVMRLHQRAQRS